MNPAQPSLSDLLARYLDRQASAHEEGLGFAEASGEVVPHDAVPVQPVEPRLAWSEAVAALRYLTTGADVRSPAVPPEWPALVASHEPEVALPFCTGNFPQLVRHLPALLQRPDPIVLRTPPACPASPTLIEWAGRVVREGKFPQALLAVGVLRLARQFDAAAELLRQCQATVPAAWRDAWANEEAALAWQRGQLEDAVALWGAQRESAPVLFNRGMAALFLGRPEEARSCLGRAVALLPEDSAWHHLGRLYLALAEIRAPSITPVAPMERP